MVYPGFRTRQPLLEQRAIFPEVMQPPCESGLRGPCGVSCAINRQLPDAAQMLGQRVAFAMIILAMGIKLLGHFYSH